LRHRIPLALIIALVLHVVWSAVELVVLHTEPGSIDLIELEIGVDLGIAVLGAAGVLAWWRSARVAAAIAAGGFAILAAIDLGWVWYVDAIRRVDVIDLADAQYVLLSAMTAGWIVVGLGVGLATRRPVFAVALPAVALLLNPPPVLIDALALDVEKSLWLIPLATIAWSIVLAAASTCVEPAPPVDDLGRALGGFRGLAMALWLRVVVLVLWFGIAVAGAPGPAGHSLHRTVWLVAPIGAAAALLAVARGMLVVAAAGVAAVPRAMFVVAGGAAAVAAGVAVAQLPTAYVAEAAPLAMAVIEGGVLVLAAIGLIAIVDRAGIHELRGRVRGSAVGVAVLAVLAVAMLHRAHGEGGPFALVATLLQLVATAIVAARCDATRHALTRAPGLPSARIVSGS
jgi:hypothetical protein